MPVQLPAPPALSNPSTHFIYLRRHEPRMPDPDSPRSLFVVNLPIDTTEFHLRHLFGTQLSAGRVERVDFDDAPFANKKHTLPPTTQGNLVPARTSKKRKRETSDELQSLLDQVGLPSTWDRQLQRSGARAVVVFVDKPSMEASLKAAIRCSGAAVVAAASKKKGDGAAATIVWGEGITDDSNDDGGEGSIPQSGGGVLPPLGLKRYLVHERLRYPARADLLRIVNRYMTLFEQVAEARKREEARKVQGPDEDGFVTVTHGAKVNSAAREEELKAIMEKKKEKEKGLEDFYRFQSREKRKERQNELLRKFDADKKKLEEMKKRKGKIRPE